MILQGTQLTHYTCCCNHELKYHITAWQHSHQHTVCLPQNYNFRNQTHHQPEISMVFRNKAANIRTPIQEITLITNFIQQNQSSADFTVRCVTFFACGDKILKGHFSQHSFLDVCTHKKSAGGSVVAGAQSVDSGKLCCFHKMLQWCPYLCALFGF